MGTKFKQMIKKTYNEFANQRVPRDASNQVTLITNH